LGYIKISDDRIEVYDDHIEIKLTGRDLNGADGRDKGADGSILHFWGKDVNVNGNEVLGLVASYTVWVKEPEYVGKLAATIGADWRDENGNISQSFTGYNYMVTTKPRVVFGHSVGPDNYDEIMDVKKVCELLQIENPADASESN